MGLNETFAALSVPLRRDIIMQLRGGKLTAGEISSKFNVTNSDISYHFKKLKEAGLINESKYKNFIYYELDTSQFEELLHWIEPSCETLKELEESK